MLSYITREQDYALRIVSFLAEVFPAGQINIKTMSEKLLISRKFTARIVFKLKKAGIIGTTQGINGGAFLISNPNNISIYDVLNIVGFKLKLNQCLQDYENCGLMSFCKFHIYFDSLSEKLSDALKEKKISDFITNKRSN